MKMSCFEVSMGKIAHIKWRLKLADFMYGQADLRESDVQSHQDCDFGKWLYSSGLKEFEKNPTIRTIEQEHKMLHDEIKRIILLPKEQRDITKEKTISDFEVKCEHFVALLDKFNAEV
jgi:methyl-accepting chemotaxis protein